MNRKSTDHDPRYVHDLLLVLALTGALSPIVGCSSKSGASSQTPKTDGTQSTVRKNGANEQTHTTPAAVSPVLDPEEEFKLGNRQLLIQRDYKAAIEHFSNAIESWQDRSNLHLLYYERGVAYDSLGNYDKALGDLTKSIEIAPEFYSHFSRGKAYVNQRNFRDALPDFLKAAELDPTDFPSLSAAAWLLASSPIDADRDGPRAVEQANAACAETSFEDAGCLDSLACAYAETGDFENAVKWELKAREIYIDENKVDDGPDAAAFAQKLLQYDAKLQLFRSGKPFRESADAETVKY